jgi:hypothetical protein
VSRAQRLTGIGNVLAGLCVVVKECPFVAFPLTAVNRHPANAIDVQRRFRDVLALALAPDCFCHDSPSFLEPVVRMQLADYRVLGFLRAEIQNFLFAFGNHGNVFH